jgi:antitoxin component YwqK of YwqJK toxin-antitoxin module
MSKYLIPDILQYILNEYIDHTDIFVYNNSFNFKFNIKKYTRENIIWWYSNGIPGLKHIYSEDLLIQVILYHINGNIRRLINFNYVNDHQYSKEILEYFEDSNEKSRENENDFGLDGLQFECYDNMGSSASHGKMNEYNYVNNVKQGKQYEFYKSGIKKLQLNYKDGKKEGLQYYYYPNGTVKFIDNYKDDRREWFQYQYKTNGKLKKEEYYVNGKLSVYKSSTWKTSNFLLK